MTTTVYYGDDFEPTQWNAIVGTQPTWTIATTNEDNAKTSSPFETKVKYTLYQDTSTFDDWLTWASFNKLTTNTNDADYDGTYVLGMIGRWPMLVDADNDMVNDMMCVVDAHATYGENKGAICIITDKSAVTTATYRFTSTDWETAYTAYIAGLLNDGTVTDLALITDEGTAMTQDSSTIFEGFQKFYCEDFSEGVELECRAWSRKLPDDGVIVDGWPRWEDNRQVVFFWFDGGATVDNDKYYPKIASWGTDSTSYTDTT